MNEKSWWWQTVFYGSNRCHEIGMEPELMNWMNTHGLVPPGGVPVVTNTGGVIPNNGMGEIDAYEDDLINYAEETPIEEEFEEEIEETPSDFIEINSYHDVSSEVLVNEGMNINFQELIKERLIEQLVELILQEGHYNLTETDLPEYNRRRFKMTIHVKPVEI